MPKELSLVIFHRVYFVTFIEGLCPNGAYTRRLLFLKVHKSSFTEWDVAFHPSFFFFKRKLREEGYKIDRDLLVTA